MNNSEIADIASKMVSKDDLLSLLNNIKSDEMVEMGNSDKFYPFTMKLLNYYCNPNHSFHRYIEFQIKKKSGGYRQITAPRNPSFRAMLYYINVMLKAIYKPSDYAMGFTGGRSVVTNASTHIGQHYILNIDLKDFFPSIEQPRVWKRLQLPPFNFPVSIANLIAGMCSMKEVRVDENGEKKTCFVLPQGSPASPIITNMICDNLDRRLAGLAKRFGLNYSRYADDITFSSMHNVYQENGVFWGELRRIIAGQNFRINDKKTRLEKIGSRQEVTGVIVSNKLNVRQNYVRDIRNILYIWDRYGYGAAYNKFFLKYKEEKGHVKKGNPNLINVLDGKLMYLKMMKGDEDSVYCRLHSKFKTLSDKYLSGQKTTEYNITYIETNSLADFEKKNSTEIKFETSEDGHRFAFYMMGSTKFLASINKSLSPEMLQDKTRLAISVCKDSEGKQFLLIHDIKKVIISSIQNVDFDALNKDLDDLIKI
jgi:RNA-directed DNA polymerase